MQKLISYFQKTVWGSPKLRGLRIIALAFIILVIGSAMTFIGALFKGVAESVVFTAIAKILMCLGWIIIIMALMGATIGLFMGWRSVFSDADVPPKS